MAISPEVAVATQIDDGTRSAASGTRDPLITVDGFTATFSAFACPAEFPCRGPSIGLGRVDFAGRRGQGGATRAKIPGSRNDDAEKACLDHLHRISDMGSRGRNS